MQESPVPSRSSSPSDHAWNGQPRGRERRLGIGDLRHVTEAGFIQMRQQRIDESRSSLDVARRSVFPRTRTHASTNGPISHGHTVPW